MRILHSGDWHLGRVFHRVSLLEQQREALDQMIAIAQRWQPDVVVIAGDVYDRAVPPVDAVRLLDRTLNVLAGDLKLPTIIIAGNHDSMERLAFGAKLLSASHVHLYGPFDGCIDKLVFDDEHGPVAFYPVSYPDPALVRGALKDRGIRDHQTALSKVIDLIWADHPADTRAVLVTHAAVEGARYAESERPLALGQGETVGQGLFEGFSYVALGHLHYAQEAGHVGVQYCGSLYPFSFAEGDHDKSVTLVELDESGVSFVSQEALTPSRQVRTVSGYLKQLIAEAVDVPEARRSDFLRVRLLDRGPLVEIVPRLRDVFPNLLEVSRAEQPEVAEHREIEVVQRVDEVAQFEAFYDYAMGEPLDDEARQAFIEVAQQVLGQGGPT